MLPNYATQMGEMSIPADDKLEARLRLPTPVAEFKRVMGILCPLAWRKLDKWILFHKNYCGISRRRRCTATVPCGEHMSRPHRVWFSMLPILFRLEPGTVVEILHVGLQHIKVRSQNGGVAEHRV